MMHARRSRDAEGRMPLRDHLRELRSRVFKAVLALLVGTIVAWFFFHDIWDILKEPYCDVPEANRLGNSCTLVVRGIFDAFFIQVKVSVIVGAVISSPAWLYQLWAFITPALRRNERRWTVLFLGLAVPLFAAGAVLAYFTLSRGLALFLHFVPADVTPLIDVQQYLNYAIMMLLIFGLSFELPLMVTVLNLAGVISYQKLMRWWRGIIFGVFVFAAVATPSQDPFTMLAMALPICVLFGVALLIARANDARRKARADASPYANLSDDEASPVELPDDAPDDRLPTP